MSKTVVFAAVVAAVAVGGYFGAQEFGLLGPSAPTEDEMTAHISARVAEVTAAGDIKLDDFSKYSAAEADGMVLTQTISSLLNQDKIPEGYLENRKDKMRSVICEDPETKRMVEGGVTYRYLVKSADDVDVGEVKIEAGACAS